MFADVIISILTAAGLQRWTFFGDWEAMEAFGCSSMNDRQAVAHGTDLKCANEFEAGPQCIPTTAPARREF
jgi:hypothetical protein